MKSPSSHSARLACCLWIAFFTSVRGEDVPPTAPVASTKSGALTASRWNFELVPRAFQANPPLDMTVITEVTDSGKKLPPVSRQAPVYYVIQSAGYHVIGENRSGQSLSGPEVERILERALAANGYLPATELHRPTLAIFYMWGAHNLFDQENASLSDEQWTDNILERAALAGGEKFAAELQKAIAISDADSSSSATHLSKISTEEKKGILNNSPVDTGKAPSHEVDPMSNLGAAAAVAQVNAMMNPVRLFTQRTVKNQFLVDQASSDCYYVVASAYDYPSVATHVKQLLWRTRMTVNSRGVSQPQSLPTLIATAAPFFGKEMTESEVVTRRAVRDGKVEVGTPTVMPSVPERSAPTP